jgi:tRNA-dihydrouridine synthase A
LSAQLWPGTPLLSDDEVVDAMTAYAAERIADGTPLRAMTRHILGLVNAQGGARRWRQMLSDSRLLAANDPRLIQQAWAVVVQASRRAA